jgi:hypothetical protein
MTTKNWGVPRRGWFLHTWPDILGASASHFQRALRIGLLRSYVA